MADPAGAHGLESSLERVADLSRTFELKSQYSTGEPAAGASVTLVAPSGHSFGIQRPAAGGHAVVMGRTDARGQLRFKLPPGVDGQWELLVDQGPGHRDYLELPMAAGQPSRTLPQAGLRHSLDFDPLPWGGGAVVLLGAVALGLRLRQDRA